MISNDVVRALERKDITEWTLLHRDQELALIDEASALHRVEQRTRWQLVVHVDTAAGRGSARVAIDAADGSLDVLVQQAIELARATVGPAWQSSPPAAPANVALIEPDATDPSEIARRVLHAAHRPAGATVTAAASCMHENVTAMARGGFHTSWRAGYLRVAAMVSDRAHSLAIACEARRPADLALDGALAAASVDLELLASAGAPPAGPTALVLAADAMLHGGLGVWQAFADQADAVLERQGLTRYRGHGAITPGADQLAEPLSIASDGALDFGVRSSPLGDDGDAVRRFALVDRGRAGELGLDAREAALRHVDPNGGVRNLVVALGAWAGEPGDGRVVELRRLRSLAIDRYTGEASIEIALGIVGGKPFAGGSVRLDLIDALARARRSGQQLRRGAYVGPSAVRIERAELV